jgi:hypothetical protein
VAGVAFFFALDVTLDGFVQGQTLARGTRTLRETLAA